MTATSLYAPHLSPGSRKAVCLGDSPVDRQVEVVVTKALVQSLS